MAVFSYTIINFQKIFYDCILEDIFFDFNFSGRTAALRSAQKYRNEYKVYLLEGTVGRCVGLTTLSPSCAECLEILSASTSCSPKGSFRPVERLFYT